MKRLVLLFWLFAFSGPLAAQEERSFQLPLFTDGLSTRYSANAIPDGALTDALNVTLDEDIPGVPVARNGRQKYNNTAITGAKTVRGLWPFDASDGTKYFVSFSSGSFFKSIGDGAWTQIAASTFSTTSDFDCTQALGYLWCINGESVFRWDGTSSSTVSSLPLGTLIERFRNRIVVTGISGSKSRIRLSGELDGTDFTTGAMSTSPANISVGGVDDGQDVTCLMGVYQDVLIIGKRDSLWGLYGFGTTDFSLRELSREVGCIDDRTVREKNNCLYWMSKRGIEKFCGASIVRISDPIRDQLDQIVATAGNARSAVDSSQSDFQAGNLTASGTGAPVSATISPGNIVPSSWSITFNTGDQWAQGSLFHTSTIAIPGRVTFIQGTTATFINAGGESNVYPAYNWSGSGGTQWQSIGTAFYGGSKYGEYFFYATGALYPCTDPCSAGPVIRILNGETYEQIASTSTYWGTTAGHNWSQWYFETNYTTPTIRIKISWVDSANSTLEIISTKFIRGESISLWLKIFYNAPNYFLSADIDETQMITSGTYVTSAFDTGFSTPIYGAFVIDTSSDTTSTINFQTRVGTSAYGPWGDATSMSNGIHIPGSKRFIISESSFSITAATNTPPSIISMSLSAETTGYFISQCRNPSTAITKWGNFQCNTQANNGSFSYWVATGTSCNQVTRTTANWQSQTNNSAIALDTAPYVAYRALFTIDSATQTPTLQDCTINWTEGDTRPPTASAVYRDRYYLAYTSSTASGAGNDHILVLDKNDKWTMFDHHDCYSLGLYERKLYCGSSLADGFVWRMDYGTDDGGTGYTSRIRTKAFNLGEPEKRKTYTKAYFEFAPEGDATSSTTITARYVLDRGTDTFTLSSVNLNEDPSHIPLADFPFPIESPVSSRYLQLELEANGTNQPWRMFGGKIYFQTLRKE